MKTKPMNVTKKEITDSIAGRLGIHKSIAAQTVQMFLDDVVEHLGDGHRLELRDFGVFTTHEYAPRVAHNPKTGEKVQVPASRRVRFKPGRTMRAFSPMTDDRDSVH